MSIQSNLQLVHTHIPTNVQLVCVSKFHPNQDLLEAYTYGERVFGESKVQEMCLKYETLPKDIQWHFIGHLQSNKIKYIVPFVALIHGVDSLKLLKEINRQAAKMDKTINCLLQIHIAQEDTKFGFSSAELIDLLSVSNWMELTNIRICGLMGMATFTDNTEQVRNEFRHLKDTFDTVKTQFFANEPSFCELSMGMSDDFQLAIDEGSTMVRVGSSIFGKRSY